MRKKKNWKVEDLVMFSRQLSTLLSSGIPLMSALQFMVDQAVIPKVVGLNIINQVQEGTSFSEALKTQGFPELFVSFLRAAEEHGDYIFGLSQCESYYVSRGKWQKELKQACAYPFFVFMLILVALFFLIGLVLPRFRDLYDTMGIALPKITQWMLSFFYVLQWIVCGVLALLVMMICYVLILKWKKKKDDWRKWMLRIPIIRTFFQYYFTHYVSIQLGSLLHSGVPILVSLRVIEEVTPWQVLKEYTSKVKGQLLEGKSFYQSIGKCPSLFLASFPTMVALGEKSGRLDQALLSLAEGTEQLLKTRMDRFIQSLEPFLILFIGGFIAFTVISMFLPMLQLVRAL